MKMRYEVERLRREIDQCDAQLQDIVRARVELVRRIAAYKIASGVEMHDEERESSILVRFNGIDCPVERQLMNAVYAQLFKSGKALWQQAVERRANALDTSEG